ncbi:MAG: hypothetical protein Q9209_000378 [Squamulea sp. 1 TL-2023]
MDIAAKTFFGSQFYAVAGASADKSKFGYKLLAWYHSRHLPVQPVTPSRPSILVSSKEYSTVASVGELESPGETSLSIVTQPHITLKVLREAKEAGISCVWMQPGSFDDEGLEYAKKEFRAAVGGNDGRVGEGWCVLVDGDEAIRRAEEDKKEKL